MNTKHEHGLDKGQPEAQQTGSQGEVILDSLVMVSIVAQFETVFAS